MDGDEARFVTARLGGVPVRVELAEPEPVDREDSDALRSVGLRELDLDDALNAVGHIGTAVVGKLKAAMPTRATVELRLGFAVEAGKLTALWVRGRGEASMTVTLEWSREQLGAADDQVMAAEGAAGADG
jgi:Trypsin-co-occurring domain 1